MEAALEFEKPFICLAATKHNELVNDEAVKEKWHNTSLPRSKLSESVLWGLWNGTLSLRTRLVSHALQLRRNVHHNHWQVLFSGL